jgi:hypothetical protein
MTSLKNLVMYEKNFEVMRLPSLKLMNISLVQEAKWKSRDSPLVGLGTPGPDLLVATLLPPAAVVEATAALFIANPAPEQYPVYMFETDVKSHHP